jgi:hypothetical protein
MVCCRANSTFYINHRRDSSTKKPSFKALLQLQQLDFVRWAWACPCAGAISITSALSAGQRHVFVHDLRAPRSQERLERRHPFAHSEWQTYAEDDVPDTRPGAVFTVRGESGGEEPVRLEQIFRQLYILHDRRRWVAWLCRVLMYTTQCHCTWLQSVSRLQVPQMLDLATASVDQWPCLSTSSLYTPSVVEYFLAVMLITKYFLFNFRMFPVACTKP